MRHMRGNIRAMIKATKGRFFHVIFTKRTTGETRHMTARTGVRKNLTGTGLKFNPRKRNLLVAYDVSKGYRMIPIEGVTYFKSGKTEWGTRK